MSVAFDRAGYIGGGDSADLLQIPPYGCFRRLILSKRDRREADLSDNVHVLRGQYLESAVAALYRDRTGRRLKCSSRFVDPETRLGMAMDRHIVAFDDRGPGVLEIKCPSAMTFRKYIREASLPLEYSAQLNFYMGLKGWRWGSFAIANFEVDPVLLWFDVNFHPDLFAEQKAKAEEAWRLVEFGPLPDKLPHDSKACSRCPYFDQCHPGELPTPDTDFVQIHSPQLTAALADYRAASDVLGEAEELKEEAKQRIKALIGDAPAVETQGAKIYHRASVRNGIDAKKLKKEYPQAAEACATQTTVRSLRIYERKA